MHPLSENPQQTIEELVPVVVAALLSPMTSRELATSIDLSSTTIGNVLRLAGNFGLTQKVPTYSKRATIWTRTEGDTCAFRRSWAVIPLIVGTREKRTFWSPSFYAQVVTMGQVLVFREHHDDGAGSPLSNRVGGHFAATGPAPHRPRSVHPSIRANGPQGVG